MSEKDPNTGRWVSGSQKCTSSPRQSHVSLGAGLKQRPSARDFGDLLQ
jgi:hypothetical protein